MTAPVPIPLEDLRRSPTAALLEGEPQGLAASMVITGYAKGQGPSPHRHPYPEAFLVLSVHPSPRVIQEDG